MDDFAIILFFLLLLNRIARFISAYFPNLVDEPADEEKE